MKKNFLGIFILFFVVLDNTNAFGQLRPAHIDLHRKNGTKHGTIWNGHDCNCTYCWGMCLGGLNDEVYNVISETLPNNQVKFYVLVQPDEDALIVPIFYVDDDVLVMEGQQQAFTVLSGQYPYSNQGGVIIYKNQQLQFTGSVVVSVQ